MRVHGSNYAQIPLLGRDSRSDSEREDYLRRGRAEQRRDQVWEDQAARRRAWVVRRGGIIASGARDPGPWREIPNELPASILPAGPRSQEGMGSWFGDLVSGKSKSKERRKRKERAAQDIAAAEKVRLAAEATRRRGASLVASVQAVQRETAEARKWIKRVRTTISGSSRFPLVASRSMLVTLGRWEASLLEVSGGIGELDLGAKSVPGQKAMAGEVQAALAAVRQIGEQAVQLSGKASAQARESGAEALRVSRLVERQVALAAREKVLSRSVAEEARVLGLEEDSRLRASSRKSQDSLRRRLNYERVRLAEDKQFLRQLERRRRIGAH